MRRFLIALISIAALLVAASPAAAGGTAPTGTRISLFAAPSTFPADTAFYVEHGSVCEAAIGDQASDCMNADTHFDLYLDGVLQPSALVIDNAPMTWAKLNLTNYPAGLARGRHAFVGVWVQGGSAYLTLSATINFR